jgi:uncharacterized membrane protein
MADSYRPTHSRSWLLIGIIVAVLAVAAIAIFALMGGGGSTDGGGSGGGLYGALALSAEPVRRLIRDRTR